MRQRIGIARALINSPAIVFFDEPTLGLDPRGQQELLALIQRVARERNTGVILCSHLLGEVETTCDDVVILNRGEVVAKGTVTDVIREVKQDALRIQVPSRSARQARKVLKTLRNVTQANPIAEMPGWIRVELAPSPDGTSAEQYQVNNTILRALIRAKIPILSFGTEGGRLQDVFLHLTEETIQ
jgi:ABC-2 type transport system ATP-binding protein